MNVVLSDPARAASLFSGRDDVSVRACLEGTMGAIMANDADRPSSAVAMVGDFAFTGGEPDPVLLEAACSRSTSGLSIVVPQDAAWSRLIERMPGRRAEPHTRYATSKDPDAFDRMHLRQLASALPAGVALRAIDEPLWHACLDQDWSRDLVAQLDPYPRFAELGVGVIALEGGVVVSGASTYARCADAIEIEVDTRPDRRRHGLARACSAALMLACLDRDLYPNWDAHTPASLALAGQLGYRLDHAYDAYLVTGA